MNISILIAILGFGIALVALWLVSDVNKKVERLLTTFLHTHINPIHDDIRNTNRALAKAIVDIKTLNKNITAIDDMRGRIAMLADALDKLDRSIPKKIRADEQTDKKPVQKVRAKPVTTSKG